MQPDDSLGVRPLAEIEYRPPAADSPFQSSALPVDLGVTRCLDCHSDLRSIVEAARDAIFVSDRDGAILYANTAACASSGYEWRELQHKNLADLLRPDDAIGFQDHVGGVDRNNAPARFETGLRQKNGGCSLIEVLLQRLPDHRYLAVARDITERKRIEARDRTRKRALELLAADAPLAEVLEAIVRGVEAERPESYCSILLSDATGRSLWTIAAPSLPRFYCDAVDGMLIEEGLGSCGRAARSGHRVAVADISDDPRWERFRKAALRAGLRSCWSEPVMGSDGACLGTFAIYQGVPAAPGPIDLETIDHAAKLASIAVEHSRRARALRQQHELFHRLAQQVPGVLYQFLLNLDGTSRLPYASETIEQLYGLSPQQVQRSGWSLLRRIHPDDWKGLRRSLLRSAETLQPWRAEYRVRLPGQGTRWREGHAVPERLPDGSTLWHGYASDITERKQAELLQQQNEQRMQLAASVFGHAHEGIIITDAHGFIIDINHAGCGITGYARGELVGRALDYLKSSDDPHFFRTMWAALKANGTWRGELSHRRRNGERYTELLTISPVRDSDGDVGHYVVMFTDISSLKETQRRLENLAHYDSLTDLPNRVLVADLLLSAMERARSRNRLLAVCYLDLDGFKAVNDSLGHQAGDRLLIEIARRLKRRLRGDDTAARLGGDEFVLLLGDLETLEESDQALERIMRDLAQSHTIDGSVLSISASVGVALYPQDDTDPDTLLRHADQAMYQAKQLGRSRYAVFDPDHDRRARAHRDARDRVRTGLQTGEFTLHYQPKLDIRRGVVVGVEALARWNHPQNGQLAPASFLPAVEHSDFSIEFEDWVLNTAMQQMASWWRQGIRLGVSVNVSANLLQRDDFLERLTRVLQQHCDAPADHVELEVLENVALDDIARVSDNIERSKGLGVRFALDDFGTGYSSLTYLRRLPVSILKIDRTFVRDMLEDPEDLAIVESVIQLAKAFGRSVIAEGVETAEHGRRLTDMNCDLAQGFGIAPPMPPEQLTAWLRNYRPDPAWFSARRC